MGNTSYGVRKEDVRMPWNETCAMNLKMQMVADLTRGRYTPTELARAYGVSRKTIYKWVRRYEAEGAVGLVSRPRAPHSNPRKVADEVAARIIECKRAHPSFGPKKVMDCLRREKPATPWPVDSTAGALLKAAGLVKKRRFKRPYPADPQPFELGDRPNALWSADYKGQYPMDGHGWCYPLTITDNASRFLVSCQAVTSTDFEQARPVFELAFLECGLPQGILTDNGSPFASRAAGGLTRLSKWWVELGIEVHRTRPGTPTQNARHERMHGSMNRAIGDRMRGAPLVHQQGLLSTFRIEYNEVRSHEALDRTPPASCYQPSSRPYTPVVKPAEYDHDQRVRSVRHSGEIRCGGHLIYVSELLARHRVGSVTWKVTASRCAIDTTSWATSTSKHRN